MKKISYLLIVILLASLSCTKSSKIVQVDNPTEQAISFVVDKEDPITIEPNETKEVILLSGSHNITINDKNFKIYIDSKKDYLLNPSFSNYVLSQTMYHTDNPKDKAVIEMYKKMKESNPELDKIPFGKIEINEMSISGNLKTTREFLIEKIWDFSVNQPLPKQMKSKKVGDDIVKIYRESDYLKELIETNIQ